MCIDYGTEKSSEKRYLLKSLFAIGFLIAIYCLIPEVLLNLFVRERDPIKINYCYKNIKPQGCYFCIYNIRVIYPVFSWSLENRLCFSGDGCYLQFHAVPEFKYLLKTYWRRSFRHLPNASYYFDLIQSNNFMHIINLDFDRLLKC